jgi:hypothetical protein
MRLLIRYFYPSSSFLGPTIIVSGAPLVCVVYLVYENDAVEDSYRATGKITVLYISILIFQLCPPGVDNI